MQNKELLTLDNLGKAKAMIYEAKSIDEIKKIKDTSDALKAYAIQQGYAIEIQNDISEISMRAKRRIGEISLELPKDNKWSNSQDGKLTTLKEAGIQHYERYEAIANIPEKRFEDIFQKAKAETKKITNNMLVNIAKEAEKENRKNTENKDRLKKISGLEIRKGDFKEVINDVYNIDAIITDPPYPYEFIECFSDLGKYAKEHLKKDGFLAVYSGQYHLPEVITRLSEHLTYVWTFCLYHTGKKQLVNGVNIMCGWKPVLIFSKGKKKMRFSAYDVLISERREKSNHKWQQSESGVYSLIDIFSKPGELIVDPFSGAGTFGKVAIENGRRFIGAELK